MTVKRKGYILLLECLQVTGTWEEWKDTDGRLCDGSEKTTGAHGGGVIRGGLGDSVCWIGKSLPTS